MLIRFLDPLPSSRCDSYCDARIVPNCAICKKPVDAVEYCRREEIRGWHYKVFCHGECEEFDLGDRFVLSADRSGVEIGEAFSTKRIEVKDGKLEWLCTTNAVCTNNPTDAQIMETRTKTSKTEGNPASFECRCGCHHPTKSSTVLHMFPCCNGRCSRCGKWFKSGLLQHAIECGGYPEWESTPPPYSDNLR